MNPTEIGAQDYFGRSGFSIVKILEKDTKTPDFEGTEILVEVKRVITEEKGGLHNDFTYNAIKNNLKDASRKFRVYDPNHSKKHIVIIYSEDIIKEDIYSVWTGEWSPEQRDRVFKSGMLLSASHKQYIDAVAWFRKESDAAPKFVWAVSEDLKQFFPKINP